MPCWDTAIDCWPSVSILALMIYSYYGYVVEVCIYVIQEQSAVKEVIYLVGYHFLYVMFMWSLFKVMCTDIAVVPNEFKVSPNLYSMIKDADTDEERNNYLLDFCKRMKLPLVTRTGDGYIRFCNKCKHVKPDRAHHCTQCGTCILKMDHHCPWVNNCIGFSNYKFFIQFLLYATLHCVFLSATTLEYFIQYWIGPKEGYHQLHVTIIFVVSLGMGILMLCFLCYHLSLTSRNETTLEAITQPVFYNSDDAVSFNLGVCQNFAEVLGKNCCLWFVPINNPYLSEGVEFPLRMII